MGGAAVSMLLSRLRLWMTCQLLQGVLERSKLPHRRAVYGSTEKYFISVVWQLVSGTEHCSSEKSYFYIKGKMQHQLFVLFM